ncbi:MAG: hypothetical protein Kow0063_18600 [Anaerolineae bacterium]
MSQIKAPYILWSPPTEQPESDCACPDWGLAPAFTSATVTAAAWQLAPGLYRAPLPSDHTLALNPCGPAGVVVLNEPARAILDSFAHPRPLANINETQLVARGLLAPVASPQAPIADLQPGTLTAWLHITNACNLRCAYCYLKKTDETMDEATGRAAVEAIFRSAVRHGFQAVKLKYAGGEPTLNFRLVRLLHEYAQALATRAGLELREVVLSNGVALSHPMLDFIRDAGMRLMISLDGVGAAHDAQRIFANGRGSFELVARGVERALSQGVRPYISITVTGRSMDGLADAVAFALDHDLLFNLNFYRGDDYSRSREELLIEDERLIGAARAAFVIIEERLPRQSLIATLLDRASFSAPHRHTCGAGRNYLVIDPRGRVARCQMEMEDTITDVWADDPLAAVRRKGLGFQNVSVDEREGCGECPWRYWCGGGCPLLTYRVARRSDVKSPYCNVYRALYPEVLRLEGLRLLKWHAPPS